MEYNELIRGINKQTGSGFPESMLLPEFQEKLRVFINDLIQHDFQKLVSILYTMDVDENRLKSILKENEGKDTAVIIAGLVIERELQKIATRNQFTGK